MSPPVLKSRKLARAEIELLRDFAEAIETVYHPAYDSSPQCREAISSIIAPRLDASVAAFVLCYGHGAVTELVQKLGGWE